MLDSLMRIYKNCILFGCVTIGGCNSTLTNNEKPQPKKDDTLVMNDYNIIIAPDLSNRIDPKIHPKALHDTILINSLMNHAIDFLSIKNRHVNQSDVYKFDFINNGILNNNIVNPDLLKIDLHRFKNKSMDAVNYIRYKMPTDIDTFKSNVAKVYDHELKHLSGADLWNYFNETINNSVIIAPDEEVPNDINKKIIKRNQNVVILFTDGYIESANNAKGYILDGTIINKIRTAFLSSNSKELKDFIYSHPEYQLNKTTNDLHRFNIMINELVDRSKDANGVALKQPTDFQVMKIVLEKWLKDSGAPHVEIYEAVDNTNLFTTRVQSFLENL